MRYKRVDVLVNNAGYAEFGNIETLSVSDFRSQYETNVFGVVAMCKAVIENMRKRRSGRIINVSSVGGIWGQPFNDAYCSSKFALEGLTETMAPVYRQFGVHCSLVEPG